MGQKVHASSTKRRGNRMKFARKAVVLTGCIAMLMGLALPSVGSAKTTQKFYVHCIADQNGKASEAGKLVGKCPKSPSGKTTFTGAFAIPIVTITVKLKGGTVTLRYVG